jgi:glycosyltransferase involved in cell wall biosynthesis
VQIWVITVGEPLPRYSGEDRQLRSGYLAQLLAARGHQVTWWTSSFDHFRRKHFSPRSERIEVGPNLHLQFLRGCAYRRNVSVARQLNHWQIGREFRNLAASYSRPAVIVCSFPTIELSRESVRYGRAQGVPTFLDIRDLWPDEMVERLPHAARGIARILLSPLFASAHRALQGASGLIAISERFLSWGLEFAGRERSADRDRIFPIGYTGNPAGTKTGGADLRNALIGGVNPEKRIFWFAGTFVGNIDLGTVIEAARRLQARKGIQFVLTGSGERSDEWRSQARGLANVVFTGWADGAQLDALSSVAWAGLGAYRKGAKMSMPNKLFEYMSRGLPIVIGLDGDTRDLVVSRNIGLPYEAGDPASLAAVVERLADNADLRGAMSANATRVYDEQFSPRRIYEAYADFLELHARP